MLLTWTSILPVFARVKLDLSFEGTETTSRDTSADCIAVDDRSALSGAEIESSVSRSSMTNTVELVWVTAYRGRLCLVHKLRKNLIC